MKNRILIISVSTVLILVLAAISFYFLGFKFATSPTTVTYHKILIKNGDKSRELTVEFAQTNDELMKGLMNRQDLNGIDGMLFIFNSPQQQSFWMKNTYIPLDMIFFNEAMTFNTVHRNAQPCISQGDNCPSYPSNGNIKYVLETKAGFFSEDFINPNTTLEIKE